MGNLVYYILSAKKTHVQLFVFSPGSIKEKPVRFLDRPHNVPTPSCSGGCCRYHDLTAENVFIHPPFLHGFVNAKTHSLTWDTMQNYQDKKVHPSVDMKSWPISFLKAIFCALRDTGPISGCKSGMTPYEIGKWWLPYIINLFLQANLITSMGIYLKIPSGKNQKVGRGLNLTISHQELANLLSAADLAANCEITINALTFEESCAVIYSFPPMIGQ